MATKLVFIFLAVVVLCQLVSWSNGNPRPVRDTAQDATKTISDAVDSLKTGLEDLLKKVQGNELFQNISTTVEQFSKSVQDQSKVLVDKIQKSTT